MGEGIGMPISHILFEVTQLVAYDVEEMDAFLEFVLSESVAARGAVDREGKRGVKTKAFRLRRTGFFYAFGLFLFKEVRKCLSTE